MIMRNLNLYNFYSSVFCLYSNLDNQIAKLGNKGCGNILVLFFRIGCRNQFTDL